MPSTNKRINLTIPDELYARIVSYKEENGIMNDTNACYQLIIQQLNAYDNMKSMNKIIRNMTLEEMKNISADGLSILKAGIDSGSMPGLKE